MPLYEYECTACHRRTEKILKFSDADLSLCPHCGGPLERTLTAPNVQFKGGGWYKDLYASAKPASGAGESSGDTAKPSDSSAGGTEAKGGGTGEGSKSSEAPPVSAAPPTNAPAPAAAAKA